MIEFILIVALFIFGYRLRRAARIQAPVVQVHVYHHFGSGPGELQPDVLDDGDIPTASNVVSFRRR